MSDNRKNHRQLDALAYQQGFLEGAELAEFETHLRDCPECQATLLEVARFLPAMQQAFEMKFREEPELLASLQAEAKANAQKSARAATLPSPGVPAESWTARLAKKPARFLLGVRITLATAAVAAAGVIFAMVQPLLQAQPVLEVGPIDHPAAQPGLVGAPHRPFPAGDAGPDGGVDAGQEPDAGMTIRAP
jgi:anti-sigma factor RsiW